MRSRMLWGVLRDALQSRFVSLWGVALALPLMLGPDAEPVST